MSRLSPKFWLKNFTGKQANVSAIWRSFTKCLPIINHVISWSIGRGIQAYIGLDPMVGIQDIYHLCDGLLAELLHRNIYVLKQAWGGSKPANEHWLSAQDL